MPSTHRTNFDPKSTIIIRKIQAIQCVLRPGNGAVDAKLFLERPIWPRLPKKGVTQWWGRPAAFWSSFLKSCRPASELMLHCLLLQHIVDSLTRSRVSVNLGLLCISFQSNQLHFLALAVDAKAKKKTKYRRPGSDVAWRLKLLLLLLLHGNQTLLLSLDDLCVLVISRLSLWEFCLVQQNCAGTGLRCPLTS